MFKKKSTDWQTKICNFLSKNENNLVKNNEGDKDSINLLWDREKALEKLKEIDSENPKAYCYSIVKNDGKTYVMSGWKTINSIGYFISTKKVEKNLVLRYW